MIRTNRAPWAAIIALLVLLAPGAPITAETESGILDEIQAMLEAGMSEPIILKWLEGRDRQVPRPDAARMIGLKKAGATDELLAKLLELAGEAPEPAPKAEPEAMSAHEPPPAPAASPTQPRAVAESPASADGEVPVYFKLSYLPNFDEDEDEWDLFVYVDGAPLTVVPAGSMLGSNALRFRQFFAPGSHTLRVVQEQHVKRRGNRWSHAARMSELELPFELAAGERADVELKFSQPRLAFGKSDGPLSFRFVQGKAVEVIEKQGGDPERWPLICEEIEANAEGGELKKALRRQLDDCQRWAELWGDPDVPNRDEVRKALALFRYRPIPKDQPLN